MDLVHALAPHVKSDDDVLRALVDFELGPLRSDDALQRRIELHTGESASFNQMHPSLRHASLRVDPNLFWQGSLAPVAGRALVEDLKHAHSKSDIAQAIDDFAARSSYVSDPVSFVRGFFTTLAPRRGEYVASYAKTFCPPKEGEGGCKFDQSFLSQAFSVLEGAEDTDMDDNKMVDIEELAHATAPYAQTEQAYELFMSMATSSDQRKEEIIKRLIEGGKAKDLSAPGKTVLIPALKKAYNVKKVMSAITECTSWGEERIYQTFELTAVLSLSLSLSLSLPLSLSLSVPTDAKATKNCCYPRDVATAFFVTGPSRRKVFLENIVKRCFKTSVTSSFALKACDSLEVVEDRDALYSALKAYVPKQKHEPKFEDYAQARRYHEDEEWQQREAQKYSSFEQRRNERYDAAEARFVFVCEIVRA